jgi:hypothetical protein
MTKRKTKGQKEFKKQFAQATPREKKKILGRAKKAEEKIDREFDRIKQRARQERTGKERDESQHKLSFLSRQSTAYKRQEKRIALAEKSRAILHKKESSRPKPTTPSARAREADRKQVIREGERIAKELQRKIKGFEIASVARLSKESESTIHNWIRQPKIARKSQASALKLIDKLESESKKLFAERKDALGKIDAIKKNIGGIKLFSEFTGEKTQYLNALFKAIKEGKDPAALQDFYSLIEKAQSKTERVYKKNLVRHNPITHEEIPKARVEGYRGIFPPEAGTYDSIRLFGVNKKGDIIWSTSFYGTFDGAMNELRKAKERGVTDKGSDPSEIVDYLIELQEII